MATLDFPLTGGVDQSVSAKLLQAPRLVRADNSRLSDGLLCKRRGTDVFASGTVDAGSPTPVGPVRLANHFGQLLVCSEESLWTVGAGGTRLEELDGLPSTTLEGVTSLGHYGAANVVASGCAQTTAFRVYAWATYDGTDYVLHVQTVDVARGAGTAATVVPLAGVSQGIKCLKVLAIGAKVTVFWGESTNQIRYLDITSATQGPFTSNQGTTLYSDAVQTSPQWFDVAVHETGYCLVYRSGAGAFKIKRISSAHAELSTATVSVSLGSNPRFGIAGDSGSIAVVRADGDVASAGTDVRLYLHWYNNSLTETAAHTYQASVLGTQSRQIRSIVVAKYQGGTTGQIVVGFDHFLPTITRRGVNSRYFVVGSSSSTWGAASAQQPSTALASKPWMYAGDIYALASYWSSQANSFLAIVKLTGSASSRTWSALSLEARIRDGRAPEALLDDSAASVTFSTSAPGDALVTVPAVDRYSAPGLLKDPTGQEAVDPDGSGATGNQALAFVGVDLFRFQHGNRSRWQAVTVGQYTCFSGGVLTAFDGRRAIEIGWASWPQLDADDVDQNSGTGTMVAGTYQYGVCWEQPDYLGNRSQSAVQLVRDKVLSTGNEFVIASNAVERLRLTGRYWKLGGDDDRAIVMAIYRSPEGSLLLNRLEGPGVALFPESSAASSSAFVPTYTDGNNSDTIALASRELIYTTEFGAGELQNLMPPPSNALCGHESRLFFVWAESPNLVGYTKQQFVGAALAWNPSLVISFDVPIVALASQDGNLLAFAADRVYTVVGRPADNTGASTGYDPPQLLSGHVGCVSRRSVCATPVGVFFQSARGIEVLPRGGVDVVNIGAAVEDSLAERPIITSVLHVPAASEVLFAIVDNETTSATGRVLAYDYDAKVWFVRNYGGRPIVDMALDGDDVVFGIYNSSSGLTLWREDGGFDDADGAAVLQSAELGDLRLAGAGGGQSLSRITLLGEVRGACGIRISESTDSGATWFVRQPDLLSATNLLQYQYDTWQRKSTQHAFRIDETAGSAADTEGFALAALRIDGRNFGQAAKLPNWKRA